MLKLNLVTALFVSILVLTLVQENEVEAAPEPCRGLFKIPKPDKNKKPEDDEEKRKDREKSKKEKKKKEKLKLLEKFFEDILLWNPIWWTQDMENNKPMDKSAENYMKFLSYLFTPI